MQRALKVCTTRTVLDLGLTSRNGGAECRPMTWDDIVPEGGPSFPPEPLGTVLDAVDLPAEDDMPATRLPRRVVCRPTGEWASLE